MRKLSFVLALVIVASLVALSVSLVWAQESVMVTMNALGGSGQTGTATLTARGNQTEVVLDLRAGAAGVAQPAHIHDGTCAANGGVHFPLTNVSDGKSTTTVNVALRDLETGKFYVNVHRSAPEIAVSTSCGDIPVAAAAPATLPRTGDNSTFIVTGVVIVALVLLGVGFGLRRRTVQGP